eukprot:882366_1
MIERIVKSLSSKYDLVNMSSHELAEFVCNYTIQCLKEHLVDDQGNDIDGQWIIDSITNANNHSNFVSVLQDATIVNTDDAQQVFTIIQSFHALPNEVITSEIIHQVTFGLSK